LLPLSFATKPETIQFADRFSAEYGIPLTDRLHQGGDAPLYAGSFRYRTIPGDAIQKIWGKADADLARATAMFHSR
jgi:hypothetical protein